MLGTGDNVDSLGDFRPLESQSILNISQNDGYMNGNNNNESELFDGITPLGNTTSSGNEGFGYPTEWASSFGDEKHGGVGGNIAERRAATCGFNAGGFSGPTINVARFRSVSPLSSPVTRPPYITIPAGISPTELLDSPGMLRYSQAQPSPTTGTFQPSTLHRESVMLDSMPPVTDQERESDVGSSFRSQLLEHNVSLTPVSCMGGKEFELPFEFPRDIVKNSDTESSADFEDSKVGIFHLASQSCFEGDQQGTSSASGLSKTSEDGYNWRKYGQKQVKGSEFPRSYYKCTHPNCLVKKNVERFYDGEVAEIIYKGTHNHPLPQPNPRTNIGALFSDKGGVNGQCGEDEGDGGIVWRNIQLRGDSKNVPSENMDPLSSTQMISSGVYEVAVPHECLSKLVFHDEDGSPLDGKSLEDDAYLDESDSKRRKIELPFPETRVVSRGVREPRVVVQIESDVDILEDGYRWRKYGQKVVKGNPNPRSYYKCTSAGCPVRKHVERACDDYKYIITTYEGKHDHEVPAAKTNTVSNLSPATSSTQRAYALSRINTNAPKAEPRILDLAHPFEKIPDLGNDFPRSSLLGNFGTDMHPLHFPHLQNPMAYGYGGIPNFPMSLLYGAPRPPIMMPGGVDLYNLVAPVQSSVVGQQPNENDLGLIKPKQEKI